MIFLADHGKSGLHGQSPRRDKDGKIVQSLFIVLQIFFKTKSRATLDSHSWFLFLLKVGEKVALSVGHQNLITPYWDEDYSFFHSTFIQN